MPAFTTLLASEYQRLFDSCVIRPERAADVDARMRAVIAGKQRYETVGARLGIPWDFIGIIHNMESTCNFKMHLHNGDPLTAKTIQVPAGRPKNGVPPFTWEESAEDALIMKDLHTWTDWSLPGMLFQLERYNGFGYRRATINIPSPYLWSFTNQYTKGKFVADGTYSPTAVSKQCGAAAIMRRLFETQAAADHIVDRIDLIKQLGSEVKFNPGRFVAKAEELQKMLNANGAFLKVDGKAGRNTSDAFHRLTGQFLSGDPNA
jgi:lysozyme family protein